MKLVEDQKLQAIHTESSISYGSKEDDASASGLFLQVKPTEDQTKESFVSEIMKSESISAVTIHYSSSLIVDSRLLIAIILTV